MTERKIYKSDMTEKTLEFNPGNGIRINPSPGTSLKAVGIWLKSEDLIDLGESILKHHAPERLAPEGPKLDDRFKPGDWVKRGGIGGLDEVVQVLNVRPFTEQEHRVCFLVPAEAVRVFYKTSDGRQYPIASNLLVPADPPKPPRTPLAEQVGKFYRHTENRDSVVRIVGRASQVLQTNGSGLDWAKAEYEDGRKTNIFVKLNDDEGQWWEPVEVAEKTVWFVQD